MSVLNLQLPANLHKELEAVARAQGVSMDQLAAIAVAEKLAVLRWQSGGERRQQHEDGLQQLSARAARGSRERFLEVLERAGNSEPQAHDEVIASR